MNPIPQLLAGALLLVSLLGGCAVAGPAQSNNSLMESAVRGDGETSEINSPAEQDADWESGLQSDLWQSLPHHDEGDYLAAIQHYGSLMSAEDMDPAGRWDLYNNSNEGPYYVVIPKYSRSTVVLETIQNYNGAIMPTGEVFRKENAPDSYALVISNPLSEGADSLRVTVLYDNRTASFDFFYAAAIDPFPYMDNGILHIQPVGNAFGSGESPQIDDSDVFGQTNEFGGETSQRTYEYDMDIFGETNEFGGETSQWTYEYDTDIFGETNEFGAAQSGQSANTATSKTLYARYATESDLPPATREEQRLIDTYISPYIDSGLYQTNFTPDYMNEMSAFTLTIMFDSLCHQFGGYPSGADILPGGRVAGEVFEGKLMKHLPLTAQMIRKICTSYNPADGTYELNPGIGSAPAYYVITEYVELDTALRITYAHYGLAVDETYASATNRVRTEEYIKLYGTGTAVINRTDEAYAILGNLYKEV